MAIPLIKFVPSFSTTLASKVAVAATTGSLSTNTDMNGTILATGKYGFTIDRNNSSKEYFTATVTGTSLTNIATVNIVTGVETSGLAKAHRKGAEIIISDFVAIKRMQDVLETGYVDTYVPTTDFQIATKAYADGLTIGGAPNADASTKGIEEIATVAEINSGATVGSTGAALSVTSDNLYNSTYKTRLDALEVSILPVVKVYESNATWTKPALLKWITVEGVGGGGAGYGTNSDGDAGGAGGAGGYFKKFIISSSLGATESVTIGLGGVGQYAAAGTAGGTTTFGSHCTGNGGGAGSSGTGGVGGTATGGNINIQGGDGGRSSASASYGNFEAGTGGSSYFGGGGAGIYAPGSANPGRAYGSGGGGVGSTTSSNGKGGDGKVGVIIVTEYF